MRALILAGGDRPDPAVLDARWPGWRDVALVIAADGGARHAAALALPLHRVIGDFDSLGVGEITELEAAGVTVTRFSVNKDATDTELAVLAALDAGATEITLLCTWGGRSDHAVGTLALLAHPRCRAVTVKILDEHTQTHLLSSGTSLTLRGGIGRVISLTPWGGDATVSATGVRWTLDTAELSAGSTRGISNVATATESMITVHRGAVLVSEGGEAA
ncbi:MAG: thiamine diphosphokinase [Candidatus Limnocylindrus sp.]